MFISFFELFMSHIQKLYECRDEQRCSKLLICEQKITVNTFDTNVIQYPLLSYNHKLSYNCCILKNNNIS